MKAELEMPPGFRFHPTDDELVSHYLIRKCASQQIAVPIIAEIDLYKFNPWELPDMALYGEKEWYFFSPRNRKYPNGSRPNRAAGTGYWKATGADKPIGKPKPLGIKKALVFYAGKAPKGVKTNWIMHEYRLANVDRSASKKKNNNLRLDDFVLCRIYNKKGTIEKYYPDRNETVSIQAPAKGHHSLAATSDSFPNSSCSDHLPSSDVTCDHKEVQSLPKWEEPPAGDFNDGGFLFNTTEWLQNDPFAPQSEYMEMQVQDPFQDMLMYFEKPF